MVSDEALFAGFRGGNRADLESLVRRHQEPLYRFLSRWGDRRSSAEDLFQETWMNVIRGRETYDPSRPFKTWLYSIALNTLRRARRDKPWTTLEAGATPPSAQPPADEAERREMAERVRAVVDALPQVRREVFLLYEFGELTYPEIARALERPLGTVKSQMHYALKQIRSELEKLGVGP